MTAATLLVIAEGAFTDSPISPAWLAAALVRPFGVRCTHLSIAPTRRAGDPFDGIAADYWDVLVRTTGDDVHALPAGRAVAGAAAELLSLHAWAREHVRTRQVRWIHSFGSHAADVLAAPLAAELGVCWLRTSTEDAAPRIGAPHTPLALDAVHWAGALATRALSTRGHAARRRTAGTEKVVVVLPPNAPFTPRDVRALGEQGARQPVVMLPPYPPRPVVPNAVALDVADGVEIEALLGLASVCLVPESGSWLEPVARCLGAAVRPVASAGACGAHGAVTSYPSVLGLAERRAAISLGGHAL